MVTVPGVFPGTAAKGASARESGWAIEFFVSVDRRLSG
jgi:hypothetical protein